MPTRITLTSVPALRSTIPTILTTISGSLFSDCTGLKNVTIPANVTSIGNFAFWSCTGLKTVRFEQGSKLRTIGESAFDYCSYLESIVIPSTVTNIGLRAFGGIYDLTAYCESTSKPATWDDSWNHTALTYWYSETQPTTAGSYWHYVNGEPTVWGVAG